mmetsp:Transcript_11979/g.28270  ORF Transcript_11979/g.28270 Transcript_11979/m.28270 type:complete len:303 (+) Transcript_11979:46-954(+)
MWSTCCVTLVAASIFSLWVLAGGVEAFAAPASTLARHHITGTGLNLFNFGGGGSAGAGGASSVPKSPAARDSQAIGSIKAALASPKNPSFRLVEAEFPVLAALNKLGDGSLRSAKEAEAANLQFALKLAKSISIPFVGPKVYVVTSSTASGSFAASAAKKAGASVISLKDGLPDFDATDIVIFLTPSTNADYRTAESTATSGTVGGVIIINGYAKDAKSVKQEATMGYFYKPLTYNSQIAGYLVREYPSKWTAIDAVTNSVLGTFTDEEILVRKTNTPDLRTSVKLVQKSFDERAIEARRRG